MEERVVRFRATTILAVLGIAITVALLLHIIWIAREVLTWILIAVFFALALNPAVDWFQRHGIKRRGLAAAVTFLLVLGAIAALGALFIPTLVDEVNGFVDALPGYVNDVTHRRGRLGFLESKYHVTERVRTRDPERRRLYGSWHTRGPHSQSRKGSSRRSWPR